MNRFQHSMAATIERERIALQARLDAGRPHEDRHKMGQFPTPLPLAMDIMHRAQELLGPNEPVRLLEPAVGSGVFLSAALTTFGDRISDVTCYEIDPYYGEPAAAMWSTAGLDVIIGDFTTAPARPVHNLVISNPPYTRSRDVDPVERARLLHATTWACGVGISVNAGLFCHFMALAHAWMAPGGIAGWLIPSVFMDIESCAEVRRYLCESVTLIQIHRFDPLNAQFDNVDTTAAVVWIKNAAPAPSHMAQFTFGGTLGAPESECLVPVSTLTRESRWTKYPSDDAQTDADTESPVIGDFFTLRGGITTGSDKFFIMTSSEIADRQLPIEMLYPMIPKSRLVTLDEIHADERGWPVLDDPRFLLDCALSEDDVRARYPSLWAYLEAGKANGVSTQPSMRSRSPWYAQRKIINARYIIANHARLDSRRERPFRLFFNHSIATMPSSYTVMYPRPFLSDMMARQPGLDRQIWNALLAAPQDFLVNEAYVFAGGLYKAQISTIAAWPIPTLTSIRPRRRYWTARNDHMRHV